MTRATWIRLYRLGFAALAAVAIADQGISGAMGDTSAAPHPFSWGNFFSFFTIQSNIVAIAVLILLATRWQGPRSSWQTLLRGGAVAWIATTGVVNGVLLEGFPDALQLSSPWFNTVLHKVIPPVMVVDWLVDRPRHRLSFQRCLVWAVYPLLYLVYSLVRGPLVDWYPYDFLDPDEAGGYAGVASYGVGITIGFLAFIWLIVTLGNRPWEERASQPST